MYVAVLVLLFLARMWSVHGVHGFLGTDAEHGEMAGVAGRLPGQSTEVAQRGVRSQSMHRKRRPT